jgi:hypothetical protein
MRARGAPAPLRRDAHGARSASRSTPGAACVRRLLDSLDAPRSRPLPLHPRFPVAGRAPEPRATPPRISLATRSGSIPDHGPAPLLCGHRAAVLCPNAAHRLHGVHVKPRPASPRDLGDRRQRLEYAGLVVDGCDRDRGPASPTERLLHRSSRQAPVRSHRQPAHVSPAPLELLRDAGHGGMLQATGHEQARAREREVVRLRPAAGEDHVARITPSERSDGRTVVLDERARAARLRGRSLGCPTRPSAPPPSRPAPSGGAASSRSSRGRSRASRDADFRAQKRA